MNPYSRGKQILMKSLQRASGQTEHVQRNLEQTQMTFDRTPRTFEQNQRTSIPQTQNYPMTSTPLHPGQDERQPLETSLSQIPLSDLLGSVLNGSTDFMSNICISGFGDAFDSFQQTEEPLNSLDRRETMMSLDRDYIHDENNENTSTCMDVIGAKSGEIHGAKNFLMPDGTVTETNGRNNEVSGDTNQVAQQDIRHIISGTEGESPQINGMVSMTIPGPETTTDDRPICESGDARQAIVGDDIGIPLNQECRQEQDQEKTLDRDMVEQPRRKRKGDPSSWTKHIHKRRREAGQVYEGRKYSDGVSRFQTVVKDERKIGERCHCKVKKNVCHTITDEERQQIFKEFWSLTWHEKKVYVHAMVETTDVQRKTVEDSRRSVSFVYFLKVNGHKKQVCKTMFLGTTGLKNTWLHQHLLSGLQNREIPEGPDDQGQGKQSRDKQFVTTFLQSLPKLPSHYCRQSTSKAYLEPIFRTFSDLYKTYQDRCGEEGVKIMGRTVFMEVLHDMNIGLFQPRKDQCDTCCAYEAGNIQEEEWTLHRQRKETAQKEKENDKKTALDGNEKIKVITMDLQRVLLSPSLQASALYYKTKLTVHNFTVYDLATKKTDCFVWNESEGGLSGNEFATCVYKYLEKDLNHDKYIIFSDGCTYQNRNCVMSTALRHFAQKYKKTVVQKYLEKGHTQMEVDSCHSKIESRLKKRNIYVPFDYVGIIREARQNPSPYEVEYLDHTFFMDFAKFGNLRSIRPGRLSGDPTVTSLRALMYLPDGSIQYKLNFTDQWNPLPDKRGNSLPSLAETPSQLYDGKLKIPKTKFDHLQQLKSVIPSDFHSFYDNLKYQ